jgi:hypothetical protein
VIAQGSSTEELAALKTAHDEALAAITKACEIGTFLHHLGIKTSSFYQDRLGTNRGLALKKRLKS